MSLKKDGVSSLLQMQFLSRGIKNPSYHWVPNWQMFQVRKAFFLFLNIIFAPHIPLQI